MRILIGGAALGLMRNERAFEDPARITSLFHAAEQSISAGVLSGGVTSLTDAERSKADAEAGARLFAALS